MKISDIHFQRATQPPIAHKHPKELQIHGHTRIDPYFWLNQREDEAVLDYLKAENAYRESVMKETEELQEHLYQEIIGRIKQQDESVPYKDNGYYYYVRYEEGKEYPIYCRKKESLESPEIILLNVNEMAEGHEYYQVVGLSVSPNNRFLSFGVDTVSRRQYTLHVKDLETGETLPDRIKNTTGGAAWAGDNRTFFYNAKDPDTLRSHKIFRHELRTSQEQDTEVYHETDETYNCYAYKTKSDQFIMIGCFATLSSEYRFIDAQTPLADFQILQEREPKHEYYVAHFEDKFYIRTNWDALNFRLMETSIEKPQKSHWKEVIAHRENVLLEGIEIFRKYMVVDERENGLTQLRIIDQEDQSEHYLDFGEEAYTAYVSVNPDFHTEILRYGYTSMTTPNSTFDYDMNSRNKKLLKQQEVVGDFDSANYETRRLYAEASDGERIPISLVYRKGIEPGKAHPLLLYAYGSYGATIDPGFSSTRLSLLDRGWIFAIAHIRGGQVMGRWWYDDGKMLKKKNTFTDYIACAEHLIQESYTKPENLFAYGGSAGGLLMGAVANLRPELFKGMIAAVPFVDVVTTMLDTSIPLTTGEYDEWGNPNNKEFYEYILSYSPYDNVVAQNYPHMLVTTGLNDSQVQYWEPAKWVAKLRDVKTDDHVLLLYTNMDAGHGGASGRFRRHKETAMEYAFLLTCLNE